MGGAEVQLHPLLTSALGWANWSVSCLGRFTPGKQPRYPLKGGCVGHRPGMDVYLDGTILFPTRFRRQYSQEHSVVAIPPALSWLPILNGFF